MIKKVIALLLIPTACIYLWQSILVAEVIVSNPKPIFNMLVGVICYFVA